MKKLLVSALVVAVLASYLSQAEEGQLGAKSYLGKTAPAIRVKKWLTPEPDRKGKFVLLDFWATWCGPCREGIAELNQFHEKFGDKLVVIGVSREKERLVRKFTEENIKYCSALDETDGLTKKFEITVMPHVVIINPAGIVVWEGHELSQGVIESLLKQGS